MYKLKFLIVLAVFQVSSSILLKNILKSSNLTTTLRKSPSYGEGYGAIALFAEFTATILSPFAQGGDFIISKSRWSIQDSFDATRDVKYHLYTKNNPNQPQELRLLDARLLNASNFNANHPTRIIIHGWLGSEFSAVNLSLRPAYLRKGHHNVIFVDWGRGAIADYTTAKKRVHSVGIVLAKLIDFLYQMSGANFKDINLIGFSMGAHIAGIAGKCVENGRIPVIVGLDPALPLFSIDDISERLTNNDADYVEVIHTNAGTYGYENPIGDADFYVNYGSKQPGCFFAECNHFRAFKVFAESLSSKLGFWGKGCETRDFEEILRKKQCFHPTAANGLLGGDLSHKSLKGVFYLKTNSEPPFAKGEKFITN